MPFRYSLALTMTAFLTWTPVPTGPAVLGAAMEANRMHLNSGAVTAGATVCDGDGFSTEAGGMLLLRGDAGMLQLGAESTAIVRSRANGAQGTEAELDKGTLAFSSAHGFAIEIVALGARICPVGDVRTFAQVSITGPKELRIHAQRGSLQLSYRGETETLAEGRSYRVILDPTDDVPNEKNHPPPKRLPKGFKIVIIGEGAAVVGLGIHEVLEPESPDRP